ncbi:hypothetical protein DsansV1_C05g0052401 [Dioscorea sansibarensis]
MSSFQILDFYEGVTANLPSFMFLSEKKPSNMNLIFHFSGGASAKSQNFI